MKPVSMVILGAPGLGKSTLAGSVMELPQVEKTLLLVAKPGEEKSFLYQKYGLSDEAEFYCDIEWDPEDKEYIAKDYLRLKKRLKELRTDTEYDAVIIDPGTDVVDLIEHHILSAHAVGSPGELKDTMGFYRQLKDKASIFVKTANILSTSLATRPKFVLIPWHTQPVKPDQIVNLGQGMKEKQLSADSKGKDIEYQGKVLPMLEGSYRRKLAADVDLVVYCDIQTVRTIDPKTKRQVEKTEHVIQVVPNKDRHSKVRIAPTLAGQMIPNSMLELLKAVENAG